MSKYAIQVDNLGKQFQIGLQETTRQTFREKIVELAQAPFRRFRSLSGHTDEKSSFWAIRHLCFDVEPGDVLAIIGRNGAGKSTLLKLLSRISEPTEGRAVIRGRVASLLEVGTGFHNELSGRENVYLNGAILGMRKAEIDRKFDEIVAFSGVEKFLDTAIKRYSSGMKVRLAFAVAAHLEPEILIIDEVLAVGDHEFQQRCLGKMQDVSKSGRTVLFVSHNIAAIQALCTRAILLEGGQLSCQGTTSEVLETYMRYFQPAHAADVDLSSMTRMRTKYEHLMESGCLQNDEKVVISSISIGDPLSISVSFVSKGDSLRPVLGAVVKNSMGIPLFTTDNRIQAQYLPTTKFQSGTITLRFDSVPLCPGRYSIDLYLGDETNSLDSIESALSFEVTPSNFMGAGKLPPSEVGQFLIRGTFEISSDSISSPI